MKKIGLQLRTPGDKQVRKKVLKQIDKQVTAQRFTLYLNNEYHPNVKTKKRQTWNSSWMLPHYFLHDAGVSIQIG